MATFLDRLGRSSFRRRRLVVAAWAITLIACGIGALVLQKPTATSFSVPGTESQQALEVLGERFSAIGADGATARVVVQAPDGQALTSEANQAAVRSLVAEVAAGPQVALVLDPFFFGGLDPTETLANIQVTFSAPVTAITDGTREALFTAAAAGREAGLTVEVGGDALTVLPVLGGEEVVGVLVAAVVLVLTLGSLVAAGFPLAMALVSVGIGVATIGIVTHVVELSTFTITLAIMLGLAVAIDYSLFIVSRYRHELATGREPSEAIGRAVATAGSAVVFAGSTVVIALVALAVVGIPLLIQVGFAAAFTVAVSVLVALTLLPALTGFAGDRLRPAHDPEGDGTSSGVAVRWARLLSRHAVPVAILASVALLVIALPALDLRLGLPDDSSAAPDTTRRKAYDLLSEGFGPGINGPLVVIVDARASDDRQAAVELAAQTVRALPGVQSSTSGLFDERDEVAMLQVTPTTGPSAPETEGLVATIRAVSPDIEAQTGATLAVTGRTALNIDISDRMADALVPYLLVVVGLSLVLLALVFRSVLVPIKATLGFLLSLAATLGAVVVVFQWGWLSGLVGVAQPGPVLSLLPIIIIGMVFGLAMDYEVFLVTRMREEHVHGADPTEAMIAGFGHGAKVVAAAAFIMISVFAGFVLSHDALVKTLGFALAVAVLFDAFVVRMTIVPAVMVIAGRHAWWLPRWLDRLLPSIDVEGRALTRGAEEGTPAR